MILHFLHYLFILLPNSLCHQESSEQGMMRSLLENYDASSRPVLKGNDAVKVSMHAILQQVVDLDEKNQTLFTSLLIQLEWLDEPLALRMRQLLWHDDNQDCTHTDTPPPGSGMILPAVYIWTPDLYVYNNAADGQQGVLYVPESRVHVNRYGRVTWKLPVSVQSSCKVDVLYFPFDHQICDIRLASWTYDRSQMQFRLINPDANSMLVDILENVELAVPEAKFIVNDEAVQGGQNFSQIILRLHIRRRTLFYCYTVIAPSILLCILTASSFWLPSGNAKKIDIGLTVFLFLYFLQVLIAENTPESNSTPLIGTFLAMVMTLNSISIVFATSVLQLHAQSRKQPCSPPPQLVWLCVTRFLGPIALLQHRDSQEQLYADLHGPPGSQCAEASDRESASWKEDRLASIMAARWLYAARVADRLLLQIYLLATLVAIVVLLIYLPASIDTKF